MLCKSEVFFLFFVFFFPSAVLGHFPRMHLPWCYNAGEIIRGSASIRQGGGKQQLTDFLDKTHEEGLP